jgi:hypothetical protein
MGGLQICVDMAGMNGTQAVFTIIFALMLLAAVFGYGTDDVNGTEARQGTTIVNNYHNNTTVEYNNTTIMSEPEWFSQGGIADTLWTEHNQPEENRDELSSYNFTECEDLGGYGSLTGAGMFFDWTPECDGIPLTTITTQSGQMLVIHEATGFSLNTTCQGETVQGGTTYGGEWRAPGHAMNCTHEFYIDNVVDGDTTDPLRLWSVAYSFRDVTVVP